ncbi:MAG: oxygenase MpaB family protein [Ilumatobacter fluminis]|uniref:oxygenase MpaB family protein n=1 Tax=Ilumatobacter fluminis TaxID=467091 RepID=UPI0032EC63A0
MPNRPPTSSASEFALPTDDELDRWRNIADPPADYAVAAYFAAVDEESPGQLFGHLVRHTQLPPEDRVPAIADFFEAASARPDWVDDQAVERGQAFFNRLVSHQFAALYFASLPSSYAAAKGVQVLHMTGRLRTDTERRLNETAQFMMDISGPGALDTDGVGVQRILHVRLMHAAVRWMIANDPSVKHVPHLDPPRVLLPDLIWSSSWGLPGNQEDLVGTWLTFTAQVYDTFDASGVEYTERDISDHLHMWRLVGHHLGVAPRLVPSSRRDADALHEMIWHRQQAPSASGVAMTEALLDQAHHHMPRPTWPLIPTTFRHFLGDDVADMIEIPPANWTRHVFPVMNRVARFFTRGSAKHPLHARVSAYMGRHLMQGLLDEMRHGDRPDFAIPDHLAE